LLLVIGLAASAALLAWKLISEEAAPHADRDPAAPTSRPAASGGAAAESLPASRPAIDDAAAPETLALAPAPGSIRGQVKDRGGIAVNHGTVRFVLKVPPGQRNFALVSKYDEVSKVDEEGRFSREVPGGGIYQVIAEAEGFAPASQDGVKPGDEVELILDVGASLSGLVVDKAAGTPIEGCEVVVSHEKGATVRKTVTSATGEFRVQDLPAGKLVVSVEHERYVPRPTIEHSVEAGEAATLRIELDGGKSIKGQVIAAEDGRHIEGATVTIRKKKARTDPTGRFHVRGLEPESHDVQVAAEGFQADQRTINLAGSRVEAVAEIQLNRGATIRGRVQNEKAEPIANAEFKLFEAWGNWSYEDWMTRHLDVRSAADGTFKLTGIPGREWLELWLRVKAEGYPETFEKGVRVARNDDDVYVVITLRPGATISGRVIDQENRPVSGARLELRLQNAEMWWTDGQDPNVTVAGTDAAGEFRFDGLGFNTYSLSVHVRGFSSAWRSNLDLTGGASVTNLLLSVEAGAPVKGIVVGADDRPIVGATVHLWNQKGGAQAVSGEEGVFTVESISKGPWDVYATAVGYAYTHLSKQLPASDIGLRIVMKREAVLRGMALDALGRKPVPGVRAHLTSAEETRRRGWNNARWSTSGKQDDGKFQIQAPPGTYTLEVMARGFVSVKKEGIVLQAGVDPEPLEIEMKRGGAIEGIVRAENGQPAPWVQVSVGRDDGTGAFTGSSSSEHDGYFFIGDLDSGTYTSAFQQHGAPLLILNGVYVGGDRPAFVDAQIQTVGTVTFEFTLEKPKAEAKDQEVVAGATNVQPPPRNWRVPRVRVWTESVDGTIVSIGQHWDNTGRKLVPTTRKDIYVNHRKEKFPVVVNDLPAGRHVLRATAKGYVDVRIPFQVQNGSRWTLPVEMKLLPKDQRPTEPEGPRLRTGFWQDGDGNRHVYQYFEDE
jgi:hypothetical protein